MENDNQQPARRKPGPKPLPREMLEEFVECLENGAGVLATAKELGQNWASVRHTVKRSHPDLWERWKEACASEADAAAEEAAQIGLELAQAWRNREVCAEGSIAVKAAQAAMNSLHWQAERRDPKRWGAKQGLDITGGVTVSKGPDMSKLTQAQLEALSEIPDS